jgi:hypothetical protein
MTCIGKFPIPAFSSALFSYSAYFSLAFIPGIDYYKAILALSF